MTAQISSRATPSNSIAARQARKNVAENVPRLSFIVIPGGSPVCPSCGSVEAYECRRPNGALRSCGVCAIIPAKCQQKIRAIIVNSDMARYTDDGEFVLLPQFGGPHIATAA